MKKKPQPTLKDKLLQLISCRSETTLKVAVARLGYRISDAEAAARGRSRLRSDNDRKRRETKKGEVRLTSPSLSEILSRGRSELITILIGKLVKEGQVVRLRKGVYGPPPPKLFASDEAV